MDPRMRIYCRNLTSTWDCPSALTPISTCIHRNGILTTWSCCTTTVQDVSGFNQKSTNEIFNQEDLGDEALLTERNFEIQILEAGIPRKKNLTKSLHRQGISQLSDDTDGSAQVSAMKLLQSDFGPFFSIAQIQTIRGDKEDFSHGLWVLTKAPIRITIAWTATTSHHYKYSISTTTSHFHTSPKVPPESLHIRKGNGVGKKRKGTLPSQNATRWPPKHIK